jgi:hypothetical protein
MTIKDIHRIKTGVGFSYIDCQAMDYKGHSKFRATTRLFNFDFHYAITVDRLK